jgi:hypothetical protein
MRTGDARFGTILNISDIPQSLIAKRQLQKFEFVFKLFDQELLPIFRIWKMEMSKGDL